MATAVIIDGIRGPMARGPRVFRLVRRGAIALDHPLGAFECRLMTTMRGALERPSVRRGLQTMCEVGGMANATIVERW